MSSVATHHPEDGLLLRYIDGELPGRKARHVARHLEACWQCRTAVEDLQSTVADCVRYRQNVAAHLPPPPSPWPALDREFARADASFASEPWLSRAVAWLRAPSVRPWAFTAAAASVLACLLYFELHRTPAVQAAVLLNRAVAVAAEHPRDGHRILVRTKSGKFARETGSRRRAKATPEALSLESRFDQARYDWDDPLTARAFNDWRGTLPAKTDQVTTAPNPEAPLENCYQIRTSAAEGNLATATLMLSAADLRPVEARFEFRDGEWVELTDMTDASTREGAPPALTHVEPPVRQAEPSQPGAYPSGSASISDELQVLAALHEVGADLGDPVEVNASAGRILVSGVGLPQQRQSRIRAALEGIPHVDVQFSESGTPPVAAAPDAVPSAGSASHPEPRIEKQFGARSEFERFSSLMLDQTDALMAHAYAVRGLAQRFPAAREAELSLRDRQVLRDLLRDHASALEREAAGIQQVIKPILTSMGAVPPAPTAPSHTSWQSSADDVLAASRRVERLMSQILGVTPAEGDPAQLPTGFMAAMSSLRTELAGFANQAAR